MTDHQTHEIRKFLQERSKNVNLQTKTEEDSISSDRPDIELIQSIIFCVTNAEAANKKRPIPDLDEEASLTVYFIQTFGYKPGDQLDITTIAAFLTANDFVKKCRNENWIDDNMKITQPDKALRHFNELFAGTDLSVFDKIER